MRLTLRTLLAWLDGVLPGDEQQQLSTKVASSAFATQLVERIRTAVGRTAIGAPQPDGRGLTEDPNSVAEYLDNTLLSEQLEAFERICLESEVHLAEVSACHGLLAEVSRDPALQHRLKPEDRDHLQPRSGQLRSRSRQTGRPRPRSSRTRITNHGKRREPCVLQ